MLAPDIHLVRADGLPDGASQRDLLGHDEVPGHGHEHFALGHRALCLQAACSGASHSRARAHLTEVVGADSLPAAHIPTEACAVNLEPGQHALVGAALEVLLLFQVPGQPPVLLHRAEVARGLPQKQQPVHTPAPHVGAAAWSTGGAGAGRGAPESEVEFGTVIQARLVQRAFVGQVAVAQQQAVVRTAPPVAAFAQRAQRRAGGRGRAGVHGHAVLRQQLCLQIPHSCTGRKLRGRGQVRARAARTLISKRFSSISSSDASAPMRTVTDSSSAGAKLVSDAMLGWLGTKRGGVAWLLHLDATGTLLGTALPFGWRAGAHALPLSMRASGSALRLLARQASRRRGAARNNDRVLANEIHRESVATGASRCGGDSWLSLIACEHDGVRGAAWRGECGLSIARVGAAANCSDFVRFFGFSTWRTARLVVHDGLIINECGVAASKGSAGRGAANPPAAARSKADACGISSPS